MKRSVLIFLFIVLSVVTVYGQQKVSLYDVAAEEVSLKLQKSNEDLNRMQNEVKALQNRQKNLLEKKNEEPAQDVSPEFIDIESELTDLGGELADDLGREIVALQKKIGKISQKKKSFLKSRASLKKSKEVLGKYFLSFYTEVKKISGLNRTVQVYNAPKRTLLLLEKNKKIFGKIFPMPAGKIMETVQQGLLLNVPVSKNCVRIFPWVVKNGQSWRRTKVVYDFGRIVLKYK